MKTAAGIAGILLGIFSLTYVGIFGSMIGSAAGLLGAIPFRGNTLGPWAEMVSMLSWLAPLLTIAGGIVAFASPRVGGIMLGVSAFLHWQILGFGQVGKLFVFPIGATAALALFARTSTRSVTNSVSNLAARQTYAEPPTPGDTAGPSFDRAKWNALLQYDKDIALMAEKLRPLGEKWLDEFASAYLALNDKTYLPAIEQKIVAAAKAEAEENERQKNYWEEQRKASLQEQERLAQERKKQQDNLPEEGRRKFGRVIAVVFLLAATGGGAYWYYQKLEAEKVIAAEKQRAEAAKITAQAQAEAETKRAKAGPPKSASAQSQSTSTLLPVQEGRYARADFPCDTAPMAVRDVIVRGRPTYSPQFGVCKSQIVMRAKGVYVVSANCTGGGLDGRDRPPITTYKILSRTRFLLQNEYGQSEMRWCSGL